MKKAGDLFSAIIDEDILGKVREYSGLFSAWEQLTKKYGIASAASHSKLLDIKRDVLLVETDHPGWIQILQTKKHLLLRDLQRAFPGLNINGIAFKLGTTPMGDKEAELTKKDTVHTEAAQAGIIEESKEEHPSHIVKGKAPGNTRQTAGYKKINNKELAKKLKNLENSIISKLQ